MPHDRPVIVFRSVSPGEAQDDGTYRVTVSTDAPMPGMLHEREVLEHSATAIDFSRVARNGIPVIAGSHSNAAVPVGRIQSLRIEGEAPRRLVGRMRLSASRPDLARDISDGILTDLSIGALVPRSAWVERDNTLVATRWTPAHAALVAAGEDLHAQIERALLEGESMETERHDGDAGENRATEVARLFQGLDGEEWLRMERDALRDGSEPAEVARAIDARLREIARESSRPRAARVQGGRDKLETFCDLAQQQIELRTGLLSAEESASALRELHAAGLADLSLRELAREYLRARDLPVTGNDNQIIARAMATPAVLRNQFSHTTSDFANLLAASADKSLARGYTENAETYQAWTRNETLGNFRSHSFPAMSGFGDLDEIPESGELAHGTFSDKAENLQLRTYGKLVGFGRQMIVNDDVGMIARVPRAMGRAAARKVGDLVYAVLTDNATMTETGRALFNTTDGNLASSGAAISTTSLDAGRLAMRTRTAPSPDGIAAGAKLNTRPRYLLVPAALETTAEVQIASEKDPGEGTTTSFDKVNPFRNRLQVIAEARLDDNSATAWYLVAGQEADVETVSVGWLNGVMRPRLDQESGFEILGITFRVAIDCDAGALDWRGVYKDPGA